MRIPCRSTARRTGRSILAVALVSATMTSALATVANAYPKVLVPARGAYLGAHVGNRSGETGQESIRRVEREIGRRFAIDHQYARWDTTLPTPYIQATWKSGRIPFVNWKAQHANGSAVSWSAIADGDYDAWIGAQADRLRAWGHPMYLTFHHEPENDPRNGTPSEYAAAYRHVVEVFRHHRVRNVAFVWTMMSWTFSASSGRDANDWYPGDDYVDIVGSDGYNWYPRRGGASWTPFAKIMKPSVAWARAHDKPLFVVEYGALEDPANAGRKGAWLRRIIGFVARSSTVKALIYFDTVYDGYAWVTDSSSSALAGYRRLAQARVMRPMRGT